MKKYLTLNTLFWITYTGLLVVMLPHTAWVAQQIFDSFITAVAFAFVFELSIFAFSVQFKHEIESARRLRPRNNETDKSLQFRRYERTYGNVYFVGLFVTAALSGLANFTYAAQQSTGDLKAFDRDWETNKPTKYTLP